MPFRTTYRLRTPRDKSLTLWRYMPFHRFEELVSTSHLHFHSLSELEDKFEGTFSCDPIDAPPIWYPKVRREEDELDRIVNPIAAEADRFRFYANERPIT